MTDNIQDYPGIHALQIEGYPEHVGRQMTIGEFIRESVLWPRLKRRPALPGGVRRRQALPRAVFRLGG